MRYLQTYKLFESSEDDIKQTIKHILLPISDGHFQYEISVTEDDKSQVSGIVMGLIIRVVLWTDEPLLITDDIKEEFMRMKDYLESEGYNSILARYWRDAHHSSEPFDYFINNVEGYLSNLLFVAKKI